MYLLLVAECKENIEVKNGHQDEKHNEREKLLGTLGDHGGCCHTKNQHDVEDGTDRCKGVPSFFRMLLYRKEGRTEILVNEPFEEREENQSGNEQEYVGLTEIEVNDVGDTHNLIGKCIHHTEGKEEASVTVLCHDPKENQAGQRAGKHKQRSAGQLWTEYKIKCHIEDEKRSHRSYRPNKRFLF